MSEPWNRDRLVDVELLGADFDAAACATPGISPYCTSRDWAVSATRHLHPGRKPIVVRRDGHWVALTLGVHEQVGPFLQPFEADWGFASPLMGPDSRAAVELLCEVLASERDGWQVAVLTGLTFEMTSLIALTLDSQYRVVLREGLSCQMGRLSDGLDPYMSRRSSRFRRNLRRDQRRAKAQGIEFELVDSSVPLSHVMPRIMSVERRSWKHASGQSVLASPRYRAFYMNVMQRGARRGARRVMFAKQGDTDLAYVFGGVMGGAYRGFQLGFDDTLAHLGLGNQVQMALIEALIEEGCDTYDLGMAMAYKDRWADETLELQTAVVIKSG